MWSLGSLVIVAMKDNLHVRCDDHYETTGYKYGVRDDMDNVLTLAWKMVVYKRSR